MYFETHERKRSLIALTKFLSFEFRPFKKDIYPSTIVEVAMQKKVNC